MMSGTLPGEGSAAPTGRFSSPEGAAVDDSTSPLEDPSAGDVYVVDAGHDVVDKFSSTGAYIGQLAETSGGSRFGVLDGVGVDASGELWVYQEVGGVFEVDNFSTRLAGSIVTPSRASRSAASLRMVRAAIRWPRARGRGRPTYMFSATLSDS